MALVARAVEGGGGRGRWSRGVEPRRWDEALFRIEQWSAASPSLAEPAYLRAMALFNANRREEAFQALEAAKALAPGHPIRAQAERILSR